MCEPTDRRGVYTLLVTCLTFVAAACGTDDLMAPRSADTNAPHASIAVTPNYSTFDTRSEFNGAGVRVNAVCPGMVDTPMIQGWFASNPDLAQAVLATMPGGKLGQPNQVAEAAVWLCSDRADWVSGLSMVVDGGGMNH